LESRKLINIFFVGQSEFNKTLMMDQNKATKQRISVRYHLKPLTEKETAKYIQYRLKIANATREIFQPKAIREVFYLSRGNPRLLNILCDRCLLTGYSKGLQSINDSIVKECGQELQITVNGKNHRIDKQVFSQKKENQDPRKTFKYRFPKIKAASIALIILAWCIAGFSYYKSKNGNSILSEHIFSPVEQNESNLKKGEEFFTRSNFANEIVNTDPNNYAWNAKKEQIEHPNELIYFNHNSNELNSRSLRVLDKLSKFIRQHPDSRVIIEGYTDSKGNYWYNKRLSETRADIVKGYLVERGISPRKIKAVGLGSENPIASNETFVDRKKNRRVEIKISFN
jgi:general secretion pathway protein A